MKSTQTQKIYDALQASKTIILCRHTRPDGDALGSTQGMRALLRATWPEKTILLINQDRSCSLPDEEDEDVPSEIYENATVVVLDCGDKKRVANANAFSAKTLLKIDHHIEEDPYGDVRWVERERAAVCEMCAEFAFDYGMNLTKEAASWFYLGILTDTDRFHFRSVSPRTLRIAAQLLETGIDTDALFNLIDLKSKNELNFNGYVLTHTESTQSGVLSYYLSKETREAFGLNQEEAGNAVNLLATRSGSLIWAAFLQNDDGSVRIRLRSRAVSVQPLAARYDGGGHANACGANLKGPEEIETFLAQADKLHREFKEQHPELQ